MRIPQLDLPHVVLAPGDDARLARAIEAGLYAKHLIDEGVELPQLHQVMELGEEATQQLAWVGIRMALKFAKRTAHLSGLPEDELFRTGASQWVRPFDASITPAACGSPHSSTSTCTE